MMTNVVGRWIYNNYHRTISKDHSSQNNQHTLFIIEQSSLIEELSTYIHQRIYHSSSKNQHSA